MLEGSRTFDLLYGTLMGATCFALGLWILWNYVVAYYERGISMFGRAADPGLGLQLAWGIFTMAMGGTNVGCRYVPHDYLLGVHEGFFVLTVLVIAIDAPRLRAAYVNARVGRSVIAGAR